MCVCVCVSSLSVRFRQLSIGIYIVERKLIACSDIFMCSTIFIRFIDNSNRCTVFTLVPMFIFLIHWIVFHMWYVWNGCVIKSPLEKWNNKKYSEYEMEMKNWYKCIQTANGKHESQSCESLSAIFASYFRPQRLLGTRNHEHFQK